MFRGLAQAGRFLHPVRRFHVHQLKVLPVVQHIKCFSSDINEIKYGPLVTETLESLGDKFSELIEDNEEFEGADATLSDGVLTVALGNKFGTYVINKQTPNKQIWLSSPISGPKRFDFVAAGSSVSGGRQDCWVYSHTGQSLHEILDKEIGETILKSQTGFQTECYLGGQNSNH